MTEHEQSRAAVRHKYYAVILVVALVAYLTYHFEGRMFDEKIKLVWQFLRLIELQLCAVSRDIQNATMIDRLRIDAHGRGEVGICTLSFSLLIEQGTTG